MTIDRDGDVVIGRAIPGARSGEGGANLCAMPTPEPRETARIYAGIRRTMIRAHCEDKRPHHKCAGEITISRDTITLQCRRCGDVRKTLEKGT